MKSVGIDIGSSSVKVVEIVAASHSYRLTYFKSYSLESFSQTDPEVQLVQVLRTIQSSFPKDTHFVLGLDSAQVTLKKILLPFKERFKILKVLPFELEDDLPFSQEDVTFDIKMVGYYKKSTDLIAVVCPNVHIRHLVQLCESSKIKPQVLSVGSLALANLFETWHHPPKQLPEPTVGALDSELTMPHQRRSTRGLLNIGNKTTSFLLFDQGSLVFSKTFRWGGYEIIKAVADEYEIHIKEARNEVQSKSFVLTQQTVGVTEDQIYFSNVISKVLTELVQKIELILVEVERDYHMKMDKLYFTGGGAQIKNLKAFLERGLACSCEPFTPPSSLLGSKISSNEKFQVSTALGLAIEGVKLAKNPPVNLLKGLFSSKEDPFKAFAHRWGALLSFAMAFFFLFTLYTFVLNDVSQKLSEQSYNLLKNQAQKQARLPKSRSGIRSIKEYIKNEKTLEKNKVLIKKVSQITSPLAVLNSLSSVFPREGFFLHSFEWEGNILRLEGEVDNQNRLSPVVTKIRQIFGRQQVIRQGTPGISPKEGWRAFQFSVSVPSLIKVQ